LRLVYSNNFFLTLNSLIFFLYYIFVEFFVILTSIPYTFFTVVITISKEYNFYQKIEYSNTDLMLYIFIPSIFFNTHADSSSNYLLFNDVLNNLSNVKEALTLKYLDTLLFNSTTLGYFYFGDTTTETFVSRYSPFLSVQKFKHSTILEIV